MMSQKLVGCPCAIMIELLAKDCFCPLQDSVVEQLLISHADVKPAMIVRGTVVATEPFGSFIQLADGLRALCPLQHMSDFQRTAPSAKFQVLSGFFQYFVVQLDSNIFETSSRAETAVGDTACFRLQKG
jgi:hypothetical protein